jgi:hypothetical protein
MLHNDESEEFFQEALTFPKSLGSFEIFYFKYDQNRDFLHYQVIFFKVISQRAPYLE